MSNEESSTRATLSSATPILASEEKRMESQSEEKDFGSESDSKPTKDEVFKPDEDSGEESDG